MTVPAQPISAGSNALVRVVGDHWTPVITFKQANGQPLDLTGASVTAEFFIGFRSSPIATLTVGDGLAIPNPAGGSVVAVIAPDLTSQAPPQDPLQALSFPTRLVGTVIDSLGRRHTDALVLFCPVDVRRVASLTAQDDSVTVTVALQGPAGASAYAIAYAADPTIGTEEQFGIHLAAVSDAVGTLEAVQTDIEQRQGDVHASQQAAATSEGNAASSATLAAGWASTADDTDVPGAAPGSRSARHYADKAAASKSGADASAAAAQGFAGQASASAMIFAGNAAGFLPDASRVATFVDADNRVFGNVGLDLAWDIALKSLKLPQGSNIAWYDTLMPGMFAFVDADNRVISLIDPNATTPVPATLSIAQGSSISWYDTLFPGVAAFVDADNRVVSSVDASGQVVNTEVIAARGDRADLNTRLSQSLTPFGTPKYRFGIERLRETRQRIQTLRFGEARQLVIASIGDSYTHNAARWSGPAAANLISQFGDAGGGWCGFGFLPSGNVAPWTTSNQPTYTNGNVRPSTYGTKLFGSIVGTYYTEASVDLASATLAASGDAIEQSFPASPALNGIDLHWIGTGAGSMRYGFAAQGSAPASWTTLDVSGTVGTVAVTALSLTGLTQPGTLRIEWVSGTVKLGGVNLKSAANGVRWHKIAATGSQARQWAAVNPAQWQTGLAALAPNLVIVMHGTNDQGASRPTSSFGSDIGTILDSVRAAAPTADLLVVMPAENQRTSNTYPMTQYAAAAAEAVAMRDAGFVDSQLRFGVNPADYAYGSARPWYASDLIHPDPPTGGRVLAGVALDALLYA